LRAVSETVGALEREAETCALAYRNCREHLNVQTERSIDYRDQLIKADNIILSQRRLISNLENMGQPNTLIPWLVAGAAVAIAGAVIVF